MEFHDPPRRARAESVVPMINVVFLLLIFFLMTATIAPPEPFEVDLPTSAADDPSEVDQALYVSVDGALSWQGQTGEAIYPALAAAGIGRLDGPALILRADKRVEAVVIARLLKRLAGAGVVNAQLVAEALP